MTDKSDVIDGLKHHGFKIDENKRHCESCPYNQYGDNCETILARDALICIEIKRESMAVKE